jgi:secondary thiamine-phosphate synthase enzyme
MHLRPFVTTITLPLNVMEGSCNASYWKSPPTGTTTLSTSRHRSPRGFAALFQRLIPDDARNDHEATWNDDNGHSHLRASMLGAGVTLPFGKGKLLTGEYQQIVLIDFDTRPRRRTVIATTLP